MGERLTKSDIEKIEKEIEERKLVKRPELIDAVKEARAQGDLSENFEYYAAKREKNMNESRIRYLERMLKFATIVEEKESADDEAALNKTVTVYFPDDDETETFRIVTSIRGNSLKGLISQIDECSHNGGCLITSAKIGIFLQSAKFCPNE